MLCYEDRPSLYLIDRAEETVQDSRRQHTATVLTTQSLASIPRSDRVNLRNLLYMKYVQLYPTFGLVLCREH